MQQVQKGFSAVMAIIIILVLAVVGSGGYFGYTMYLAPMLNPYAKLVPEGLKEYAIGENADAFIVYKKDAELESQLKKLPTEMMVANSVNSALVLVKGSPESVAGYVEFSSENEASMAKKYFDESQTKSETKAPIKVDIKKNVLVITSGQGESAFTGKLLANSHMGTIDKERLADQLIILVNNSNLPGLNSALPSEAYSLPATDSLSSAMIYRLLKTSIIYLKLKDGVITSNMFFNMLSKTEIPNSEVLKPYIKNQSQADWEKEYDQAIADFSKSIPDLNRATGFVKMFAPSVNITMALKDLTFTVDISSPLQDLVDLAAKNDLVGSSMGAPKTAQDAVKKTALNTITIALEQNNAMNGTYPDKSMCVEEMTDLAKYFKNSTIPTDKNGKQTFGDIDCQSGYYYQVLPGKSYYVLWAKMELPKDGNMTLSPAEFAEQAAEGKQIEQTQEGEYYIFDQTGVSTSPSSGFGTATFSSGDGPSSFLAPSSTVPNTTQPKVKVKRQPTSG